MLSERVHSHSRQLEDSPLPAGRRIQRQQTTFSVQISVERGLTLQQHLVAKALAAITDPESYKASQRCGDAMRERQVQAFEVHSARSPESPPVVGVMTPYAFSSTPFDRHDWTLEISAVGVTAVCFGSGHTAHYPRELFLINGCWPVP